MANARKVQVIEATINPRTHLPTTSPRKRRVAAYARVSTDSDEQAGSYDAQIDYYTRYICSRPDWEFVKVYPDDGISGLSTKKREQFMAMINDALAGKIDYIITKSISRFARNTVDTLTYVRMLKDHGVGVYFEKENIDTLDAKGELLITIMSSLAQEESRSISENVIWGQRKRFADGKVTLPYKRFLGYDRGASKDDPPVVNEEQAVWVRYIYSEFMLGKTACAIAKALTASGVPSPSGKPKWSPSTVESILSNEKYKGDALLQKTFTVDFLSKKKKVNEGEHPQYYVEHSHEAIIDPREWQLVQLEMARRKSLGMRYSGNCVLATRIVCGDCGSYFGPKVWNSTSKYKRTIWQCNNKFKGETKCSTPHIEEQAIKSRLISVLNFLLPDKQALLEDCRLMQDALTDCTKIDEQLNALTEELEVVAALTRKCIAENAAEVIDEVDYKKRYDSLNDRYNITREKIEAMEKKKTSRIGEADKIGAFMFEMLERDEPLDTFDDRLWIAVIDHATVFHDGRIVFTFVNGMEAEG